MKNLTRSFTTVEGELTHKVTLSGGDVVWLEGVRVQVISRDPDNPVTTISISGTTDFNSDMEDTVFSGSESDFQSGTTEMMLTPDDMVYGKFDVNVTADQDCRVRLTFMYQTMDKAELTIEPDDGEVTKVFDLRGVRLFQAVFIDASSRLFADGEPGGVTTDYQLNDKYDNGIAGDTGVSNTSIDTTWDWDTVDKLHLVASCAGDPVKVRIKLYYM